MLSIDFFRNYYEFSDNSSKNSKGFQEQQAHLTRLSVYTVISLNS